MVSLLTHLPPHPKYFLPCLKLALGFPRLLEEDRNAPWPLRASTPRPRTEQSLFWSLCAWASVSLPLLSPAQVSGVPGVTVRTPDLDFHRLVSCSLHIELIVYPDVSRLCKPKVYTIWILCNLKKNAELWIQNWMFFRTINHTADKCHTLKNRKKNHSIIFIINWTSLKFFLTYFLMTS